MSGWWRGPDKNFESLRPTADSGVGFLKASGWKASSHRKAIGLWVHRLGTRYGYRLRRPKSFSWQESIWQMKDPRHIKPLPSPSPDSRSAFRVQQSLTYRCDRHKTGCERSRV